MLLFLLCFDRLDLLDGSVESVHQGQKVLLALGEIAAGVAEGDRTIIEIAYARYERIRVIWVSEGERSLSRIGYRQQTGSAVVAQVGDVVVAIFDPEDLYWLGVLVALLAEVEGGLVLEALERVDPARAVITERC